MNNEFLHHNNFVVLHSNCRRKVLSYKTPGVKCQPFGYLNQKITCWDEGKSLIHKYFRFASQNCYSKWIIISENINGPCPYSNPKSYIFIQLTTRITLSTKWTWVAWLSKWLISCVIRNLYKVYLQPTGTHWPWNYQDEHLYLGLAVGGSCCHTDSGWSIFWWQSFSPTGWKHKHYNTVMECIGDNQTTGTHTIQQAGSCNLLQWVP